MNKFARRFKRDPILSRLLRLAALTGIPFLRRKVDELSEREFLAGFEIERRKRESRRLGRRSGRDRRNAYNSASLSLREANLRKMLGQGRAA